MRVAPKTKELRVKVLRHSNKVAEGAYDYDFCMSCELAFAHLNCVTLDWWFSPLRTRVPCKTAIFFIYQAHGGRFINISSRILRNCNTMNKCIVWQTEGYCYHIYCEQSILLVAVLCKPAVLDWKNPISFSSSHIMGSFHDLWQIDRVFFPLKLGMRSRFGQVSGYGLMPEHSRIFCCC